MVMQLECPPKVGDRVNLKATATELSLGEDEQPLMVFFNKEQRK